MALTLREIVDVEVGRNELRSPTGNRSAVAATADTLNLNSVVNGNMFESVASANPDVYNKGAIRQLVCQLFACGSSSSGKKQANEDSGGQNSGFIHYKRLIIKCGLRKILCS